MKQQKYVWLIIVILLPFVSVLSLNTDFASAQGEQHFVVGISNDPYTFDPHDCYDSESRNILFQIMEGLYAVNLSSPDSEKIPLLASAMGTWSPDFKNLTIPLRMGVTFHDGSPFDASVVKWNFDRLIHHLVDLDDLSYSSLFKVNDQWILNRCEIVDTYTVKFVLNFPNVVWESLLTESFTFIFKPDSMYWDDKITLSDVPIGTGPFKLDSYEPNIKLEFSYYPDYYQGWFSDHIEEMEFRIIPDPYILAECILNYSVDFVSGVWSEFIDDVEADPYLTIADRYKSSVVYYIQMNVKNMPLEVRLASQFVWNYSYWLDITLSGNYYDLHSPIPDGFQYHHDDGTFYNGSYDGIWPSTNILTARQYILSCSELAANISATGLTIGSSDQDWIDVAESGSPLAWYNFTRYQSSTIYYSALQLKENLKDVGIRLEILDAIDWSDWVNIYLENPLNHKYLTYSFGGWGPDFNDPINMAEYLYKSGSFGNVFELSDSYLDYLFNESYSATSTNRRDLFYEIQEYFVSEAVPTFYIMQRAGSRYVYHNQRLSNVDHLSNVMGILYFYPCTYAVHYSPNAPIVNPISPDPNTSGTVHIDWILDPYVDTYYIYRYSTPITEINGSVQNLGSTPNSYWNDPVTEGIYYYAVQAFNASGYSDLSNSVGVTVDIPGPSTPVLDSLPSPDLDGIIELTWDDVVYASSYNVYRYISPITEVNGSVTLLGSPSVSEWTDQIFTETTYYYALEGVNATGISGLSNSVGVSVDLPGPDTPILDLLTSPDYDGALTLTWNDVDLTDSYSIYQYTSPIISLNSSVELIGTTGLNLYFLAISKSGLYYFAIQGVNGTGLSGLSNTVGVVVVFPIDLDDILPNPDPDGVVNLNWDDVSGASSYTVYRYTSLITEINGSITNLGDITVSAYQDSGLTNGDYYYVVIAHIAGIPTPISNCVHVQVILEKPRIPGFSIGYLLFVTTAMMGIFIWKSKK